MWRLRILEDLFHETSVTCLWLQQNKIRGWQTAPATWLPHRPPVTPPAALVCCKLDNSNLTWNPSGKLDMYFLLVYVVHVYTSTCVYHMQRWRCIDSAITHSLIDLLARCSLLPAFLLWFLSVIEVIWSDSMNHSLVFFSMLTLHVQTCTQSLSGSLRLLNAASLSSCLQHAHRIPIVGVLSTGSEDPYHAIVAPEIMLSWIPKIVGKTWSSPCNHWPLCNYASTLSFGKDHSGSFSVGPKQARIMWQSQQLRTENSKSA